MSFFQVLDVGLIDELHQVPDVNVHAWEQMLSQWRLNHERPRDFVACLAGTRELLKSWTLPQYFSC